MVNKDLIRSLFLLTLLSSEETTLAEGSEVETAASRLGRNIKGKSIPYAASGKNTYFESIKVIMNYKKISSGRLFFVKIFIPSLFYSYPNRELFLDFLNDVDYCLKQKAYLKQFIQKVRNFNPEFILDFEKQLISSVNKKEMQKMWTEFVEEDMKKNWIDAIGEE